MRRSLFRSCVALVALALGACSSYTPRRPVVVADVDADIDDIAALAYLCQEHKLGRIELKAVTVTNKGAGLPGKGLKHVRCTLAACGLPDVVVADDSPSAESLFPAVMRDSLDGILSRTFETCTLGAESSLVRAPQVLTELLQKEDLVRVVTLGPLSNLAEALKHEPKLKDHIESVYVMGGAVEVPGNLCCGIQSQYDNTQEFNIFADAAAARTVLELLPPETVALVPLDATKAVPVTQAFAGKLASRRTTPEADLVSSILSDPNVQYGIGTGLLYWWDPLTVVAATRPAVVSFEVRSLEVVQEGLSSGRTKASSSGQRVRMGVQANQARFEELFLDSLNGR